jgi:hypothetical protein
VLLTESDGSWTAADPPPPATDSSLSYDVYAVSCWSASQCVAVGDEPYSSDGILLTDAGGSWTAAVAPLPSGTSDPVLVGVSCSSASQCVAVGWTASGPTTGLLLTEAGGSWTAAVAPVPADHYGNVDEPDTVACPSDSMCLAAGTYADGTNAPQAMLLTDDDGSWTAAEAPVPADADGRTATPGLATISCSSASQCTAVGGFVNTSQAVDVMFLTWS